MIVFIHIRLQLLIEQDIYLQLQKMNTHNYESI